VIGFRLAPQLRQLVAADGDVERGGAGRQVEERAVAPRLCVIQSQLLVEVVEPDRPEIVDAADGKCALDHAYGISSHRRHKASRHSCIVPRPRATGEAGKFRS
jgi:hypothetical protein